MYSLFGIIAFIIALIINSDVLLGKSPRDVVTKRYVAYLNVVFVYFIVDSLWGILDVIGNSITLLYIDTFVYHVFVALSIVFWCRYVVAYLNPSKKKGQAILGFGYAYCAFESAGLLINLFHPVFFWFDQDGVYQVGIIRHIVLGLQITLYVLMAVMSFVRHRRTKDRIGRHYLTIGIFCLVMTSGIVIQLWTPFLPLYSISLLLGLCTLHVFVHEDERNEIMQRLKTDEQHLAEKTAIISNAGYGIWKIWQDQGVNRMAIDSTLKKILGVDGMNLSPEELYTYYHGRIVEEDAAEIEKDDYASMRNGAKLTKVLKWNHPEKGIIYLNAGGALFRNQENQEIISGYCADITATKKQENRTNLLIKALARSYHFMTYIKLADYSYFSYSWNLAMSNTENNKYGTGDIRDAIEFACKDRVSAPFREEVRRFADIATINERMKSTNVIISQFKDVNGVWHEWSYIVANRNVDGTIKNLIWAVRKIEDEKRAEIRRQRLLDDNIAANKAKTIFLQNMSHEIRTPLNAMFGFAQLLGMPDGSWTDEEKAMYNRYIFNSYNMLDMLIGDILDIADSESGNYRIQKESVNVNQVCMNSLMSVEYRKPTDVNMYFTSDLPDDHTITSDGRRIQQVLINYLTNACKHTKEGEIHLHCSSKEIPGMLTFSVTDTGTGIPPEKADLIFNRFTKLNQFSQGSGLGLNICQMVAKKLDGLVYLDKAYTNGARFVFVIKDSK